MEKVESPFTFSADESCSISTYFLAPQNSRLLTRLNISAVAMTYLTILYVACFCFILTFAFHLQVNIFDHAESDVTHYHGG